MNEKTQNLAASIRQRLLNYAKEKDLDFNLLLYRFANERFLYRLSISEHRDQFLLKGASLFSIWFDAPQRPTRDIDLLGYGSNVIEDIETTFLDVCKIEAEDGLRFETESVKGIEIREGEEYRGVRISIPAFLGKARNYLQIDVGFGDAVTPEAEMIDFPALLDLPAPRLKAYPKETVVAEKFEAMVKLGLVNSRMKDFWDLNLLIGTFEFDQVLLQEAITATFERRRTELPNQIPRALTDEFVINKQIHWKAFLKKNRLQEISLETVIISLRAFFEPIIASFGRDI